MNILLLNPPTPEGRKFIREGRCTQEIGVWGTLWPPISLASIAAVLERERRRVQVIDCPAESMNLGQLEKRIVEFSPRAVIWSTGTPSIIRRSGIGLFREKARCPYSHRDFRNSRHGVQPGDPPGATGDRRGGAQRARTGRTRPDRRLCGREEFRGDQRGYLPRPEWERRRQ